MGALQRTLTEKNAVIGDDADRVAPDMGEAADQRGAVEFLELVEFGAVDDPRDNVVHVERLAAVGRHHAVDFLGRKQRLPYLAHVEHGRRRFFQGRDDAPGNADRMGVVLGIVVGYAGLPRMHVGTAELFGGHHFAGGRLHQRRATEEDSALIAHDDALVRHRRHISAAGGAGAHHDRDLGNALRGHIRLIVEDAAKVPLVRKDLVLHRQEGAAGIHHVDARQIVLPRDVLGAQMLLHRHRIVGAALDGGIVGHDHAFPPRNPAHTGDHARRMHIAAIEAVGRQRRQFQEGRAGIDEEIDAVARQHLAARGMALAGDLAAAAGHFLQLVPQFGDKLAHHVGIACEFG
ncbi:hypothetical protein ES703_60149 [subsurface metagenome]